jgi:hypothetical protein
MFVSDEEAAAIEVRGQHCADARTHVMAHIMIAAVKVYLRTLSEATLESGERVAWGDLSADDAEAGLRATRAEGARLLGLWGITNDAPAGPITLDGLIADLEGRSE